MSKHIAVLIDHSEARIFDVHEDPLRHHHAAEKTNITAPRHEIHRHQRGRDGEGHEHPEDAIHYFQAVRQRIVDAEAVLVLGPSTAKHELMTYLEKHDRPLAQKVIGVQIVDHPTDKQVIALAAEAFLKQERLAGRP
ncbi:MAG: hypothetical protein ABMA15_22215 [Vicinamibacterales bacterium]